MKNLSGTILLLPLIHATLATASMGEYEEIIYYHVDALGSPLMATDIKGDLIWREQYSPYGSRLLLQSREVDCAGINCLPKESAWDEKQWFTGKLEETRSGLQYFGARWYEPELGRFMSPDPVRFREDNTSSFNRYAYANNNPYKFIDPDGREVAQVGVSAVLPEIFGTFQNILNRKTKVTGFSGGVVWSYPGSQGEGEYDIGLYLTTHMNSEGLDTGRVALSYSESVDESATVRGYSGIGGSASASFGAGGMNTSYSLKGIEMVGVHVGIGAGVSVRGDATVVYSIEHGKVGWSEPHTPPSKVLEKRE